MINLFLEFYEFVLYYFFFVIILYFIKYFFFFFLESSLVGVVVFKLYKVLIGNREWMIRNGLVVIDKMDETMIEYEYQGQIAILCVIDGQFYLYFLFFDIVDNFVIYVYYMYIVLYDLYLSVYIFVIYI